MAKKTAPKTTPKTTKKKLAAKPRPTKKPAPKSKAKPAGPKTSKVTTGRGAGPAELGSTLIALFNAGNFAEIYQKLYSPKIVSIEGLGVNQAWHGMSSVEAKNQWWESTHIIHGSSAEGPFVGSTGFAVRFRMDVEDKTTGKRETMDEVAVYTVQDGKIVREEFHYRT